METDRPDNIADIQRFAKLDMCSFPSKGIQILTGRDIGHYPDRHSSLRSMGSVDQLMKLDRVYRGEIPCRPGSSMFAHLSLSLSLGSKLKSR